MKYRRYLLASGRWTVDGGLWTVHVDGHLSDLIRFDPIVSYQWRRRRRRRRLRGDGVGWDV